MSTAPTPLEAPLLTPEFLGRLEQLEAFEPVLVIHGTGPRRETARMCASRTSKENGFVK